MIEGGDLHRLLNEVTESLMHDEDIKPWLKKNKIDGDGFMEFIHDGVVSLALGVADGELIADSALHVLAMAMFIGGWEAGRQFPVET